MRVKFCGNRVHFVSNRATKLVKFSVICIVGVAIISLVMSHFKVPSNSLSIYELDEYNRQSNNDTGYDDLPLHEHSNELREKGYSGNQDQLDYIAKHLDVSIQPITNEMGRFFYNVKLKNTGFQAIGSCCWTIYLYSSKMLDCLGISMNYNLLTSLDRKNGLNHWKNLFANEPGHYSYDSNHSFIVSHVIGYTFKMYPSSKFQPMQPMETRTIRFSGFGWSVSKSEFIPNWYVANDKDLALDARLLLSTAGESLKFIGNFQIESSKIRFEQDKFKPLTSEKRYMSNDIKRKKLSFISLLPTPVGVKQEGPYKVIINMDWNIFYMDGLESEAKYLNGKLHLKMPPQKMDTDNTSLNDVILLKLADNRKREMIQIMLQDYSTKDIERAYVLQSAYMLEVQSQKIHVWGLSPTGIFYGLITLLNLLELTLFPGNSENLEMPSCVIVDAPRYNHRGLMIDVSRNFFTIESITKIVEVMATYKMNVLHLHLSDDEGWRLEIPGLPELTEIGSRRSHDPEEKKTLMSLLGSGPETNLNSGSGYYSVEEFRNFLRFATARHVAVIPEFDMPSHSHAAIVSMKARHRATAEKTPKKDFLVSDLRDTSTYSTGQFYSSSAMNPCLQSTYRFVSHVLKELVNIYKGVAPLKYFHLGGDEVPKDAYIGSQACQRLQSFYERNSFESMSPINLKTYFVENVARLAMRYNLSLIGWDDAFLKDDGSLMTFSQVRRKKNSTRIDEQVAHETNQGSSKQEIVAQYYYNVWEQGLASKPYIMADRGMKVILSPVTSLYFDSPQEPDPDDWGLHWASRYTDTRRVFYFSPGNLYNSIDFSFDGERLSKTFVCSHHPCHDLQRPENILGIEAAMWSELIRTPERMHSMLFPRLLAVAERAWHEARWENEPNDELRHFRRKKNWEQFATMVGSKELKRLESLGISYYLPRPGVVSGADGIKINAMFPGMNVQISTDGGQSWKIYDENKDISGASLLFRTMSFDGKRGSIPVKVLKTLEEKL